MERQIFLSFYYKEDNWRVSKIKNMGLIDGKTMFSPNKWEQIKRNGSNAIKEWIDKNMKYRSCIIVLIGTKTYERPWVKYEIEHAIQLNKPIFGIYINNLRDRDGNQSIKGKDPFEELGLTNITTYDPSRNSSKETYDIIYRHINSWIEYAEDTNY